MKTFWIRSITAAMFVGGVSILANLDGWSPLMGGVMTMLLYVAITGNLRFED